MTVANAGRPTLGRAAIITAVAGRWDFRRGVAPNIWRPMLARFVKMHGCGNDFVVFDERAAPLGLTPAPGRARSPTGAPASAATSSSSSSRRRRAPAPTPSCASATPTAPRPAPAATPRAASPRCWPRETGRRHLVIRTVAGDLPAEVLADGRVRVDMGPAAAGLAAMCRWRAGWTRCTWTWPLGPVADPAALSMGNPHATFFVADARRAAGRGARAGAGARSAVPRARQYRLRQVLAPDRHPAARVGARRRPDAGLRLRRLRGAGERAPARPDRPARDGGAGRRRAGDRVARRTAMC